MKRPLLLLFALVLGTTAALADRTPAEEAAGTYSGLLYIGMGSPVTDATDSQDATITLEAQGEGTVKFTLPNFKYGSMNLGDIVLNNIPVYQEADGTVRFGENSPQSVKVSIATAQVNIDHTTSNVKEGHAYVDVLVTTRILFSNVNIYVRFVGDNPDYEPELPAVPDGPATDISGAYNAPVYISLGTPVTSETEKFTDAEISITAEDANTVTFALKDFSLDGENSLGDIELRGIPVTKDDDGTYRFGANEPQPVSLAGGAITADVKIDETTSYVSEGQLYIDVPVQAMGEYIYVHVGLPVVETGLGNGVSVLAGGQWSIIYDLQGRRVTAPARHGIYIVGGKKVKF
ncbi:MAG: calycin-like domain-containing protein [Bacteroidaceae bacterium]|nr:calycin-like domain-containing protein [Bacteroidaceae bacterium]